uniref:Uncharacterized protein n=1 Tax=Panagrolaimus sp. ES5 TaxID=591445 RepID=A0AC34FT94_9BILA
MCCVSFYQEREARLVVKSFENLLPEQCMAIRDGQEIFVDSKDLVVGDLIKVTGGTKVAADARLIICSGLKVETSSITGESEPIDYQVEAVPTNTTGQKDNKSLLEKQMLRFVKFLVVLATTVALVAFIIGGFVHKWKNVIQLLCNGFLVCAIGMVPVGFPATVTSIITVVARRLASKQVYLKKLDICEAIGSCNIIASDKTGTLTKNVMTVTDVWNVIQLLCNGFLVCAIGMVPVGFPATVTSIITVVARRLASKQVYLKKLDICEAIGSCNIIASDKTGTLTKNVMTVTDVWYCNHNVPGMPDEADLTDPMYRMLEIMGICNSAKFTDQKRKGPLMIEVGPSTGEKMKTAMKSMICGKSDGGLDAESQIVDINTLDLSEKNALGSPSECAMLKYADKLVDLAQLQRENNVVFEIPFNSRRKWHLLIIKEEEERKDGNCQYKLLIKGASEIVIKMCNDIYTQDGVIPITVTEMEQFDEAYSYYGSNGRRIIGFAETRFEAPSNIKFDLEKENFPLDNLTFVGFCAIMDPPKNETAVDLAQLQRENNVVFEIPFNSRRKWHLLIIKEEEGKDGNCQYKLLIKGASEIVIKMCNDIYTQDGVITITDTEMEQFDEAYSYYGSNGRRIIGFAETRFVAPSNIKFDLEKENFPLDNLTFVGFCAIMDPPKNETADAIKQCREAGIKVFMVTGDHQITATAIGKEIGLIEDRPGAEKDWETICGEEVSRLSSADWDRLIQMKALIFARTTPEQKLLIVEECQKRKQIIAMTGDGVNDAPALKRANIGIAMGSGSEVAKDSADVILMNDNFASIVDAVREGRLMFDNLKKLLGYTQIHSYPE